MSWYADISGEITTSVKALPMVMDLIGEWTRYDSEGVVHIEQAGDTLTLNLGNHYRNLGGCLPEAVSRIASAYPEATRGTFTIMSQDGSYVAETYRVSQGRMFRRALSGAAEREVFLCKLKGRNDPLSEILVTRSDLARIRGTPRKGNAPKRRHERR